jgi:hypothetical protein
MKAGELGKAGEGVLTVKKGDGPDVGGIGRFLEEKVIAEGEGVLGKEI